MPDYLPATPSRRRWTTSAPAMTPPPRNAWEQPPTCAPRSEWFEWWQMHYDSCDEDDEDRRCRQIQMSIFFQGQPLIGAWFVQFCRTKGVHCDNWLWKQDDQSVRFRTQRLLSLSDRPKAHLPLFTSSAQTTTARIKTTVRSEVEVQSKVKDAEDEPEWFKHIQPVKQAAQRA